jgi:outer membrane protein assembly factor BamB
MNNNQHTGKYNSPSVKTKPTLLWKVKTGGQVISSPVIYDNVVYIGSEDNKLYAINAFSGVVKWEYNTDGPVNSTPAVSRGKVMFLSYDGFFYGLNQSDGKLAWKFRTGGEFNHIIKDYFNGTFQTDFWDFYLSSAIVNNGMAYFGSSDSNVYALDIETGEKIWSYKTGGNIHSSPSLYKNSLLVGSWDSKLYCLNAKTGSENWTYTTGIDTATYIFLGIQASPSVENGIAYIGSRDAKQYAFNVESGDTVWTQNNFELSWMPSTAAIGKENIYCGSSDAFSFYSISKKTGNINYKTVTKAYTFSSPAIDNEMAYIGSANGRLYGIELESGDLKWEFQTEGSNTDTIKMFTSEGKLDRERLIDLMKGVQNLSDYKFIYRNAFINTGSILSSPAISNQVIYFGSSDGYVYAITDK